MSQPTENNNKKENSSSSDSDNDQQQGPPPIQTLEEALNTRQVALQLYNKNLFEQALAFQMRVLEFYTKQYGDIALECGLPYLDYSVTLLTLIQTGTSDVDAALAGNNEETKEQLEEDLALCYENLDASRVCFEKGIEKLKKEEVISEETMKQILDAQKRLAEVHDNMGDYFMEVDDEESAIASYNNAIEIREKADSKNPAIISGYYRVGKAYYRLQLFADALKQYQKAVELAEAANVEAELLNELKDSVTDCEETIKQGGFVGVREEVEQMFPSDAETDNMMDASSASQQNKNNNKASPGNKNKGQNRLLEVITKDPLEDSMQLAPDVVIPYLPTDASNSMSHFPSQGHSKASAGHQNNNNNNNSSVKKPNSANNTVNTNVVVRRKQPGQQQTSSAQNSQSALPANATSGIRRDREGQDVVQELK